MPLQSQYNPLGHRDALFWNLWPIHKTKANTQGKNNLNKTILWETTYKNKDKCGK